MYSFNDIFGDVLSAILINDQHASRHVQLASATGPVRKMKRRRRVSAMALQIGNTNLLPGWN